MTDRELSVLFTRTVVPDCRDADRISVRFSTGGHQPVMVGFFMAHGRDFDRACEMAAGLVTGQFRFDDEGRYHSL